jgi:BirA family biotin operon repressor/biotin-[acetyl-CoA-carboxylase] ligase
VWSQPLQPAHPFWSAAFVLSYSDGSQFQALDRLLAGGERIAEPVAALALTGTGFRGQRDRIWEAARGNLHLTVAVPIGLDASEIGAALSMLPAVAAAEAIVEASGGALTPRIKWVNDLLVEGRKTGGVLSAAHTTARRIDDVVWGIGINVEVAPPIEPTRFVPATTCLHASPGGSRVTVSSLFSALLDAIARRHSDLLRSGPGAIFDAYRRHSAVIGREVRVWDESGESPIAEGVVAGIGPDLGLQLEGHADPVMRGRLELVGAGVVATPIDSALVAAIAATVSARFPGARVTRIERES